MGKMRFRPIIMIFLVDIIGFALLYFFRPEPDKNILLLGALMFSVTLCVYLVMYFLNLGDTYLFLLVSMLASIGIIMLFRLDPAYGYKQIVWFLVGIGVFFVSYLMFRYIKIWDKLAGFYIVLAAVLFILTLIFGKSINGSKNWIIINDISFQASEFIKIIFVFVLACFFKSKKSSIDRLNEKYFGVLKKDILLMLFVFMCFGFLVLQREWGTALLFFFIYITMLILYDANWRILFTVSFVVGIGGCAGYFFTDHIKNRVMVWLDPWADVAQKGYQITQSLFAITSGGYFGTGLGNGNPYFIPEVHSDFIFSAICEEMGIFTGIAIILMYFLFSYRGFKIAINTKNEFYKAVALLLTISFAYQTFIIVGGVIKLIPLTGITLPFVSYGGSSLVSSFISLGIIEAISFLEKN